MSAFGFLVVDKPKGVTSHDVVKVVRRLLPKGIKVGHTGTLDPLATGVLILSVGKATRLSEYLLKQDKCYTVKGVLGLSSDTYDVDGKLMEVPCGEVKREELEAVAGKFLGRLKQVPPPFSAVRVKGRRAYELAREGKEFSLPEREVVIYSVELVSFSYPEFTLSVCCSSGTYIRTLIHDIGRKLGCGAVVKELRRVKVGRIGEEQAVDLESLKRESLENFLLPPQKVLPFPILELGSREVKRFRNGAPLQVKAEDGKYSVLSEGKFVGVGMVKRGFLRPEKVIS